MANENWWLPHDAPHFSTWIAKRIRDLLVDSPVAASAGPTPNGPTTTPVDPKVGPKEEAREPNSVELMIQQKIVRMFVGYDTPYRGLLLYHGLGSGKTCASIAAAASIIGKSGWAKCFVLLPASLEKNYRQELSLCGDGVVERSVQFVHYNGLSNKAIDTMLEDAALFENSVIVIDEVHNFISAVANGGLLLRLYDAMMGARQCKVLLLSGTPLVNNPNEVSLLTNLVNGFVVTHTLTLSTKINEEVHNAMRRCRYVQMYDDVILHGKNALIVTTVPEGFERRISDDADLSMEVRRSARLASSVASNIDRVLQELRRVDKTAKLAKSSRSTILPADAETFNGLFLNAERTETLKREVLERRLAGKISFFRGHSAEVYPTIRKVSIVKSIMSAHQFSEYTYFRNVERRSEKSGRRPSKEDDGMVYRPYTRSICNFAFPHDVQRPRRTKSASDDSYEKQLQNAMDRLAAEYPERLLLSNVGNESMRYTLHTLSPKFHLVVARLLGGGVVQRGASNVRRDDPAFPVGIDAASHPDTAVSARSNSGRIGPPKSGSKRPCIVYSQFRQAEGIDLFAKVLEVNGFLRVDVKRVNGVHRVQNLSAHVAAGPASHRYIVFDNADADMDTLMHIFNDNLDKVPASVARDLARVCPSTRSNIRGDLIDLLLISKSGSEGISTRHVREVHILEPFWHANRIEQVIGRARRAYSHEALPASERFIDVYVYIMSMTKSQAELHKVDGMKSSDEYVHETSMRKRKVLRQVYDSMVRSSIDCSMFGRDCA